MFVCTGITARNSLVWFSEDVLMSVESSSVGWFSVTSEDAAHEITLYLSMSLSLSLSLSG